MYFRDFGFIILGTTSFADLKLQNKNKTYHSTNENNP